MEIEAPKRKGAAWRGSVPAKWHKNPQEALNNWHRWVKTLLPQSSLFHPVCCPSQQRYQPNIPSLCMAMVSPSLGPATLPSLLLLVHSRSLLRSIASSPGEYKLGTTEAYGREECSAVNFGAGYYAKPASSTSPFQKLQIHCKLLLNDNGNFSPFKSPPY